MLQSGVKELGDKGDAGRSGMNKGNGCGVISLKRLGSWRFVLRDLRSARDKFSSTSAVRAMFWNKQKIINVDGK